MEEQLITFETAKLAKDKGFDWIISDDKFYDYSGELDFTFQGYDEGVTENGRTPAPTQSLLQKWLREEHEIYIEVEITDNTKYFHFKYVLITSKDRDYNDLDMIDSAKRQ